MKIVMFSEISSLTSDNFLALLLSHATYVTLFYKLSDPDAKLADL